MSELGEGVSVSKPVVEKKEKGDLKVSVRDVCDGKRIEDAEVIVNGESQQTDEHGESTFSNLAVGSAGIKVKKHFKEADYIKFITHKPKSTLSYEAKSSSDDIALIVKDKTSKERIEISVFKVVDSVRFCRIHLKLSPLDYGHWWIEVGDKSYGWWPIENELGAKDMDEPTPPPPLADDASAAAKIGHMAQTSSYQANMARYAANYTRASNYGQAIFKTFKGVPGILNGTEEHKRKERDPHHKDWIAGKTDEDYHPVIVDCRTKEEIYKAIRDFAFAYSGQWSWRLEFGRNCHTFQKDAMKKLNLDMVKEI